jgi:hypothetical protein
LNLLAQQKAEEVQRQIEALRSKKIQNYKEIIMVQEEQDLKKVVDPEVQERLREKKLMLEQEQEIRERRREEEMQRNREIESENAKLREIEKTLLQQKVVSGRRMTVYEKKLALQILGDDVKNLINVETLKSEEDDDDQAINLHCSMLSEKPVEIHKLAETASEDVFKVMDKLAENQKQTLSNRDELLFFSEEELVLGSKNFILSVDDLLFQIERKFINSPEVELRLGGLQILQNLDVNAKSAAMSSLIDTICKGSHKFEVIQMYGCGLDDNFLTLLAEKISEKSFPSLEELHLETNQFTGNGLTSLFQVLSNGENVPNLTSVKIANQRSVDTQCTAELLNALRNNYRLNRITFDFIRLNELNEANHLLARNGIRSKQAGISTKSRTSMLPAFENSDKTSSRKSTISDTLDSSLGSILTYDE